MPEVKVKTISYRPNGNKPEENSGFDPFYGSEGENLIPFPRDRITPWYEDETKKREGIMKVASVEDEREFYGGLLSPVYRQDYLDGLPINKLKELFDQYLRDMRIG